MNDEVEDYHDSAYASDEAYGMEQQMAEEAAQQEATQQAAAEPASECEESGGSDTRQSDGASDSEETSSSDDALRKRQRVDGRGSAFGTEPRGSPAARPQP